MVTYKDLRAAVPDRWVSLAVVFRTLATAVADQADALSEVLDRIHAGWTGDAASEAFGRVMEERESLYAAFPGVVGLDQMLSEFAGELAQAQSAAIYAARPMPGSNVHVDADGVAHIEPAVGPPSPQEIAQLVGTQQSIDAAVARASMSDRQLAHNLLGEFFTGGVAPTGPLPATGTDPETVVAWWDGLSPEERRYLILNRPDALVQLDGVPADARDQASRLVLHDEMATVAEEQMIFAAHPAPFTHPATQALDNEMTGLDAIAKRMDETGEDRVYLLDLNPRQGDVVVSINNPDLAQHTVTFVPGLGSNFAKADEVIDVADNLEEANQDVSPSGSYVPQLAGSSAAIGWLDYPAPPDLVQAASSKSAATGAPVLDRFLDGLHDTHVGPDGQETVVGYSYGSVVTGTAAVRDGGLSADDVVLIGSPGAVANHASEFGVPPGHVWASVGRHDVILLARDPAELFDPDRLYFGTNPVSPKFGAHLFTSGSGSNPVDTHTSYFDNGTPSLANIAKITMGDYDDVT